MKTKDFSFELPDELIAQAPPEVRGQSRLMILDPQNGHRENVVFADFVERVDLNAVLVFNDSRVRKARVFARTASAGKIETIFLRLLPDGRWECLVNKAKRLNAGQLLEFPEKVIGEIETPHGNIRRLRFEPAVDEAWLERNGHLPLPPYIQRPDGEADAERYQTVYAKEPGSSAAPTAGLHFTKESLNRLAQRGLESLSVTLHVGLGTFLPIHTENIKDHHMHTEFYRIDHEVAEKLTKAKLQGKPIIAIGTTSLRTLESAWSEEGFRGGEASTNLFITPGYRFRAVDQLFTNFHTPRSTLLMLVASFGGWEFIRNSYEEAVRLRYRFFSYGDAMWIRSRTEPRPERVHSGSE